MGGTAQHEQLPKNVADEPVPPATEDVSLASPTSFAANGALPGVAAQATVPPTASERAYEGGGGEKDKRSAELTAKHGVRPRDYSDALDGSNTAELLVREVMPQIATFLNGRAAAQKLETRFTVAELTTNFLAEGGILATKANATENLDGFNIAGVDTFLDRYQELKPWLHPGITRDKVEGTERLNEKNEKVKSIGSLTIVQAAWANATMYAAGKARFEKWLKRHNKHITGLSDVEQFYWSTTYYNAGEGNAEKSLASIGVGGANTKWNRADDWQKYYRNMTYNAKMRTSTFELTRDVSVKGGAFNPVADDKKQAAGAELDGEIERTRDTVTQLGHALATYDARVAELRDLIAANKGRPESAAATAQFEAELAQLQAAKRNYEQLAQQLDVLEQAKSHQLGGN